MTKFQIIYGENSGLEKMALRIVCETVNDYIKYTLPVKKAETVTDADLKKSNLILIGTPESNPVLKQLCENNYFSNGNEPEGYCIKVMKNPFAPELQMIIISGYDAHGALYGAMDFKAYYIPYAQNTNDHARYFRTLFADEPLQEYEVISAPSVKHRGIWTWGHVIYDYRNYIENMARLKMNTLIVWNDCVPINISDIIDHAHAYGISIYLGFSWGWNEARPGIERKNDISDDAYLESLKNIIVDKYNTQYSTLGMDGIYFQSFTETNSDSANGVVIAERVVKLVNDTAQELFSQNPDLKLMFGLHATSVQEKLSYIKCTDNRIMIVWEDCGAFPFHYNPSKIEDYDKTCSLTEKIAVLRGENDNFGVVLKGLTCLDWSSFEHQKGEFLMGCHSREFIRKRTEEKVPLWNHVNTYWLQNADYAYKIIKQMLSANKDCMITALVEDGMLEAQIPMSVALYAEMLWDCKKTVPELITKTNLRLDINR